MAVIGSWGDQATMQPSTRATAIGLLEAAVLSAQNAGAASGAIAGAQAGIAATQPLVDQATNARDEAVNAKIGTGLDSAAATAAKEAAQAAAVDADASAQIAQTTGPKYDSIAEGMAATAIGATFNVFGPTDRYVTTYRKTGASTYEAKGDLAGGVALDNEIAAREAAQVFSGRTVTKIGLSGVFTADPSGKPQASSNDNGKELALVDDQMRQTNVSGLDARGIRYDMVAGRTVRSGIFCKIGGLADIETDPDGKPVATHKDNGKFQVAVSGAMVTPGEATASQAVGTARLVLTGPGSLGYVESNLLGYSVQRYFGAFNILPNNETLRWLFNPDADVIDGVTVRAPKDDATPDHIFNTTLGANHSWVASIMTASGHGKTSADVGSIWQRSGVEYVITRVRDANTLLLTQRAGNGTAPTGTFTHVSGATNTGSFTATASSSGNWSPPAQNMSMRVMVDGELVCSSLNGVLLEGSYEGNFLYRDSVKFIEVCEFPTKDDLVNGWLIGHPTSLYPTGLPTALRVTNVYQYDKWGGLTLARSWYFLAEVPVSDLMGIQLETTGAFDPAAAQFYIPNTLPFTYNGSTVNYSMKVPTNLTMLAPGTPSVNFTPDRIEPTGPCLMRALVLYDSGFVDAAGFLPFGSAADDVRRDMVSELAMEIRGNTGKRYFRLVDEGNFIAQPGQYYEMFGYRAVLKKDPARTAFYPVPGPDADYLFADWHNKAGVDTIELPPEFIGRSFTVVGARNATVKGSILSGSLVVTVNASADYATLELRVPR